MLWDVRGSKQGEMHLVDDLLRLGIGYHFEEEIEEVLSRMKESFYLDVATDDDLRTVALRFRLVRQAGYYVSATDVFTKFKDGKNKFRTSLGTDVRGLLNLYEVAFLSIPGEDILDEAITFTSKHLRSCLPNLDSHLAKRVRQALDLPFYKGMPRLESRNYIPFYQQEKSRNNLLLELAKLDFNLLQSLHLKELSEITSWWKELGLARELPFARDRAVELYYWILTLYYEPKYSRPRIITTKLINLATVTDDIYDVYGTVEELELLTDAIQRWELGAMERLPECMKAYYRALLDTVKEIEDEIAPLGHSYHIDYLKEAMKGFTRAYLQEAKWCKSGYIPSVEEHFNASLITAGYPILPVACLLGTRDITTREALDWIISRPDFMKASAVIARVLDDIASHKLEQEREHVASTVECYMKEYRVSEDEACIELRKMVADAWKKINQGLLRPTPFPFPILMGTLNLARTGELFYRKRDDYTDASGETKQNIISLFLNPIPV
ncbi:sesquiterpene synthase 2-like [Aristolochia californica]|uniref:sesquiterpene synthase 2-like n=1 Tax=Aristolochia californica TaxID=171875 RepID=UPI0035D60620